MKKKFKLNQLIVIGTIATIATIAIPNNSITTDSPEKAFAAESRNIELAVEKSNLILNVAEEDNYATLTSSQFQNYITFYTTLTVTATQSSENDLVPTGYILPNGTRVNGETASFNATQDGVYSFIAIYEDGTRKTIKVEADLSHSFVYKTNSTGIEITGYRGINADVVIPSKIQGQPVNSVASYAFYPKAVNSNLGKSNVILNSITIPDSVTTIGMAAFRQNNLTSVTIPNSVAKIEPSAFYQNKLTSVTLSNSLSTIESYVFYGNKLTSVKIPNSVTTIGTEAFYQNQLTSVTLSSSLKSIQTDAFASNRLTSIIIPDSVTTINTRAFYQNQLTNVTLSNTLGDIGIDAFASNLLTSLTIPKSVTSIGDDAFMDNPNLKTVYNYSKYNFTSAFNSNPIIHKMQ